MTAPSPSWRPVTEEERIRAEQAIAQLKLDLARFPSDPPLTSPGKFTGPLGLAADGTLQPPLTPEEAWALTENEAP